MARLPEFAELVEQHQSMVFSIAYHSLQDEARAEELAQDVFLSLFENLERIESEQHVKYWLRRVATQRCIDESRRRKFQPRYSLEDIHEPSVDAVESDPKLMAHVQEMVADLPAHARAVVVLRYQEEMDPKEIAEVLDIPVATVKSRLFRALESLRGKMIKRGMMATVEEARNAWG